MFNVVMSSSRLNEQFHQPTIVVVRCILFHDLLLLPGPCDRLNGILDDSYLSQFSFPDCWCCKYIMRLLKFSYGTSRASSLFPITERRGLPLVPPLISSGPTFLNSCTPLSH